MEEEYFIINLAGSELKVYRRADETFLIQDGNRRLGVIEPIWQGDQLVWVTSDLIAPDYAMQIGELIEEHDL